MTQRVSKSPSWKHTGKPSENYSRTVQCTRSTTSNRQLCSEETSVISLLMLPNLFITFHGDAIFEALTRPWWRHRSCEWTCTRRKSRWFPSEARRWWRSAACSRSTTASARTPRSPAEKKNSIHVCMTVLYITLLAYWYIDTKKLEPYFCQVVKDGVGEDVDRRSTRYDERAPPPVVILKWRTASIA